MGELSTKEKLFGFNFNPFTIDELSEKSIDLFIDREDKLKELLIFINDFSTSAIAGEMGVGKSSALIKLKSMLPTDKYLTKYLKIAPTKDGATLKSSFLRKVLRNILILVIESEINLDKYDIDLMLEADRLDFTISFQTLQSKTDETTGKLNAGKSESLWNAVIPISIRAALEKKHAKSSSTTISKSPVLHNDDTLKESIQKISVALADLGYKVVLFIDELDKLGRKDYAYTHWFQEIYDLLGYCEDILTAGNLLYVFSLQKEFYKKYNETLQNSEGDTHFLGRIHEIVLIDNFSFDNALKIIEKRIEFAGGKRKVKDIFDINALKVLFAFSFHNTRKFIQFVNHVLTEATIMESKDVTFDVLWKTLIRKHRHTWLTSQVCSLLSALTENNLSYKNGKDVPGEFHILEKKGYVKRISSQPIEFTLNI